MLASSVLSLALVAGSFAAPLAKRGGQATYFAPGLGACGWTASASDYIVAMNEPQWNGGSWCGKTITIKNLQNGNTQTATVQDECPSCNEGSLDMSPSLFSALNNGNMDAGVFPISFWEGSGGSSGGNSGSSSSSNNNQQQQQSQSKNNNNNNNNSNNNNNNKPSSSTSSAAPAATNNGQPKQAPYSAPAHPVSGVAPTGSPNVTFTSEPAWWAVIDPAYCDIKVPENVTVAAVGPTQVYNGTNLSDACGKWISVHNAANNKRVVAMVSEWVPEEGTNFLALADGYKALADMQGETPNPISKVTWGFVEHNATKSN